MWSVAIRNVYQELEAELCNSLREQDRAKAEVLKVVLQKIAPLLPQKIELTYNEKQLLGEDFGRGFDSIQARTGVTSSEVTNAINEYIKKEGLTGVRGTSSPRPVFFLKKQ